MALHKMGRPPRVSEHTTRGVSVRFTEAERLALKSHADHADKPLAVFIREVLEKAGLLKPLRTKR